MNEQVKKFLEKKNLDVQKKLEEEKSRILIGAGLWQKEYSDNYTYEYNWYDESENKYYKKVPLEITDEEYELVKKAYETGEALSKKQPHREKNNPVAIALYAIAWIIYIGGVFLGVALGEVEVIKGTYYSYIETEFSLSVAMTYWGAAFISGTLFLGLAKVIELLDEIKNKIQAK